MSTRYYPRYVRGNPQLRIFLPNFWMKLVPNTRPSLPNEITFKVPVEMTDLDVRNYLEKIYKVPVVSIKTIVKMGEVRQPIAPELKEKKYMISMVKEDDYRLAFVKLPMDMKFTFPDLFPEKSKTVEEKDMETFKEAREKARKRRAAKNWDRSGVPSWFGA